MSLNDAEVFINPVQENIVLWFEKNETLSIIVFLNIWLTKLFVGENPSCYPCLFY